MNFREIWYAGTAIQDDLDVTLFNPVASTISKWRTFRFLRWGQLWYRLVDLDEILYGDGIEYCLPQAYVGKVGILVLRRTSCSMLHLIIR
jgi:hypothetical protein